MKAFADRGGPVLGICNGFQILLEAGLLPGAMLRNRSLKYRCEHVHVRVEQTDTPFTGAARLGQVLRIPIAHGEGNYFAPPDVDRAARGEPSGRASAIPIPTGELTTRRIRTDRSAIAGICNERRNVVGMMPHPERACEALLGGVDGRDIRVRRSSRAVSFSATAACSAADMIDRKVLERHGLTPDEYDRIVAVRSAASRI